MLKKGNGGVIEPHPAWIAHAKVAKDGKPRLRSGQSNRPFGMLTPSPDAGRGKVAKDAKPRLRAGQAEFLVR